MPVEDYKEIYSLKVEGLTEDQHIKEDIPHEYRIVHLDSVAGGMMVWGRYSDVWHPNPSCRFLIAHLLKAIQQEDSGDTYSLDTLRIMGAGYYDATGFRKF